MKKAETDSDVGNVEAWAAIIEDMLFLMPDDRRMQVLQLALQKEAAAVKEREQHGLRFRPHAFNDDWKKSPGIKHWHTIMRLKSLIIQVFARNITNEHSREEAARILFATHPHGDGSGALGDYIDKLPHTVTAES
jgi:hypothetical protein